MRRILVTGGAGYIGSHTCKRLFQCGFEPVTYDNLSLGHRRAVKWGPLVVGDVRDRSSLGKALRNYKPEAVIHFAAISTVAESLLDPAKYYENNVYGTISLLEAMREAGVSTLVFSSTCAVYGHPDKLPISESAPRNPINPYGRSKLMVEQIVEDCARTFDLRFAFLRYFNACGADPDGEVAEWHDPETHLIPRALMAIAGSISHLDLYGDDYPTPDGTCIRDYIHVTDLADAHVRALSFLEASQENLIANIGTGHGISVREVLNSIEEQTGLRVPCVIKSRRPGDPAILFADPTVARERLQTSVEHSDINTIVRTAWPSFRVDARTTSD